MGIYLNPGNSGFQTITNDTYVDKTGLIEYVNSTIDTPRKLTSFSRPRRFGKSFAAKMLCAYYDRSCDSHSLFEGLEISESEFADISTFQNDMSSFSSRDDVITLLIHLGYDETNKEVYIPNLEVADAFRSAVKNTGWVEVQKALSQSEKLLQATIDQDTETVGVNYGQSLLQKNSIFVTVL